ncbi:MAG: chorismate mutase [Clostridia bacterium]|nr:MAG: chorismate mutase [Clostridia bacterium]
MGGEGTRVRGIRGAVTVEENSAGAILAATERLLAEILQANDLQVEDIVSIIFTVTPDLNAEFPAAAARRLGWREVPLLCATEIGVPGSLSRVVRVLLHAYTEKEAAAVRHIYLGEAVKLRPDWQEKQERV